MIVARVVAVVAAFRPDDDFSTRLARIADQVERIVVVDDGPQSVPSVPRGIEVIQHDANRGIAAALNTGIGRAREIDATHVLTLDQDSVLAPDYVTRAVAAIQRHATPPLGAAVVDIINGVASIPTWRSPEGVPLAPEAIQSGMLISIECLDDAGAFDESLVIDSVDRDFCHRIRARGWGIAIATDSAMEHSIGQLEPLRGGSAGRYEWHSPLRQYYIARNGLIVARRFRSAEPEWSKVMLRSTWTEVRKLVRNGPRRAGHAVASVIGLAHGVVGRRGMIPRWLARLLR